jgi:hypothetical protein
VAAAPQPPTKMQKPRPMAGASAISGMLGVAQ